MFRCSSVLFNKPRSSTLLRASPFTPSSQQKSWTLLEKDRHFIRGLQQMNDRAARMERNFDTVSEQIFTKSKLRAMESEFWK
mmetsp:Transcript_30915/g.48170  ORF Transcript_30915/g.48170 Transcript_30915/m.48170 type:complete len:82 (-) Transcript_30915:531-776(-)